MSGREDWRSGCCGYLHCWAGIQEHVDRFRCTQYTVQTKSIESIVIHPLTDTNNPIHRHINARRITRCITQQIHIRAAQLLDLGQPWDTPVVLQLLFPIWLLLNPVRHRRLYQTWRYGVDTDPILCPFHSECMRHVLDARFGGAVRGGRYALVGPVRRHGRGEDDGAFDALLDEGSCCAARGVEGAVKVYAPELVNFFGCEVQRGLVLRAACVGDHAVQTPGFGENLVDGGLDGFFFCHVGLQGKDLAWVLL